MTYYILCIHFNKVTFEETIRAFCLVWAMQIAEVRYGKGCVLGCIGENRFNDSAEPSGCATLPFSLDPIKTLIEMFSTIRAVKLPRI
ncbi:MAG: hypothetical protein QG599_2840 [Pseudomonadota bacterium]|nr:hypothetical protein [Pseudomonadota bacterium]